MNEKVSNIYKIARINAGLKREPAAEELHIDVRTLDKYEAIDGRAPDDVVKSMCILYGNKGLAWEHIKKSPLGVFLPDIGNESLKSGTLTLVSSFYDMEEQLRNIIKIAADGEIDEDERMEWEAHKQNMKQLASSLISILLAD